MNGTWGAICDNEWDLTDAGVVCRQLGYPGARQAKSDAFFGQGSGPNLMDRVACDGSEAKITECPSHCWKKPKCRNTETAGVTCYKGNYGCSQMVLIKNPLQTGAIIILIYFKLHVGSKCSSTTFFVRSLAKYYGLPCSH